MEDRQRGLTLVELMIAVAVVGILAAIAYPSYRDQVIRSTRSEARMALELRALQLEKCFTRFMAYDTCSAGQAVGDGMSLHGHYRITISDAGPTTFTLTASAAGSQAADSDCPAMKLNEAGVRTPANCW